MSKPVGLWLGCLLLSLSGQAAAFKLEPEVKPTTAGGTIQVAFTPGQDAAGLIIEAIANARKQILVQAFSFTHDGIAQALIAAHRRGVEVKLIADREQTWKMERGQVPAIAAAGVPVWLDGEHQSAHNKVMVIDADSPAPTVVTGSYNFTKAAQYKNAENLLLIRGNRPLAETYQTNWQRHLPHARPYATDKHKN
ncbi:MAG TPA: phospholipase D family protein [Methylophilaceae bacterium]|nr:phospholipase D family protein [Methylophilaceae bacterium]